MDTHGAFTISSQDAATLQNWIRSTSLPQGQITRAKIILALSEGVPVMDVAAAQLRFSQDCPQVEDALYRIGAGGPA